MSTRKTSFRVSVILALFVSVMAVCGSFGPLDAAAAPATAIAPPVDGGSSSPIPTSILSTPTSIPFTATPLPATSTPSHYTTANHVNSTHRGYSGLDFSVHFPSASGRSRSPDASRFDPGTRDTDPGYSHSIDATTGDSSAANSGSVDSAGRDPGLRNDNHACFSDALRSYDSGA